MANFFFELLNAIGGAFLICKIICYFIQNNEMVIKIIILFILKRKMIKSKMFKELFQNTLYSFSQINDNIILVHSSCRAKTALPA